MESVRFTDMRSVYGSFAEIDRLRKQYGFKVLVCIHPSLLLGEGMNDGKFAGIAGTFRFYCFRMYPYYKKANTTLKALQLDGHPNDFGHPNEFGHSLIAKAMFSELTKNGFIAFDRKDH